jgi:type II secretory pathway component HofQ
MRSIKHTCAAVAASLVLSLFSPLSAAFAADNVTMNIKDGDIRDVLTALSYLGEQSIVTDDSVKGKISIAFNDIPFETALDLVTRTKGLAYRTVHGVIVVSANEEMSKNFGESPSIS